MLALGLAEVFPSLRAYLPTYDRIFTSIKHEVLREFGVNERPSKSGQRQSQKVIKEGGPKEAVLALSWTAAFCETAPHKRECKTQRSGRYDATHFALHGLWPKEQYCGNADYQNVSDDLWQSLKRIMPGTASNLHKHEWKKHGSCYSKTPERYFADSLRLVLAFNKTDVRDLFFQNIGKHLTTRDIRAAFDKAFGKGAGARVLVHCVQDNSRRLIQELRIRLKGDIENAPLPVLLKQARHQSQGCKGGIIDAVGLQ